jgi:hypothetical protein
MVDGSIDIERTSQPASSTMTGNCSTNCLPMRISLNAQRHERSIDSR